MDLFFLKLNNFVHNKKSKEKVTNFWNSEIYTQDVVDKFGELEWMFKEITESKGETEDTDFQDQNFRNKLYYPLKEIFEYKQIEEHVKQQKQIIGRLKEELTDCKLERIDELQISSIGSLQETEIDKFRELKE